MQPPNTDTRKKALTFKCSKAMLNSIEAIKEERQLDTSSVIRLALYLLDGTLKKPRIKRLNLHELVSFMEHQQREGNPRFSQFCGFRQY